LQATVLSATLRLLPLPVRFHFVPLCPLEPAIAPQVDLKTVRLLLTNWPVGLPEAGLISGEPRTTPERSQANRVFVEQT
jgi:hypothetical protein